MTARPKQRIPDANRDARPARPKEPMMAQIASFVDLFVWLLVLKSFFLPLFIIPTGSMAETLMGAHAVSVCPNCGYEYRIGPVRFERDGVEVDQLPRAIQCPNCRWVVDAHRAPVPLREKAGDRIMVHGWPYAIGWGPQRWDVVVFKNPNEPDVNFIKRLIGLPGETIEIINGDVFVQRAGESEPRIAFKTREAQEALWFPYYTHDFSPHEAAPPTGAGRGPYLPHWAVLSGREAWKDLDTRTPRFAGEPDAHGEIMFVTDTARPPQPGLIVDHYGYNGLMATPQVVSDARIAADVAIDSGDGYVELQLSRYQYRFYARLDAAGRLSLQMSDGPEAPRVPMADAITLDSPPAGRFVRLALGHADGHVVVEVDRKPALVSDPRVYTLDAATARRQARRSATPRAVIAAEAVTARLAGLEISRDVHYGHAEVRVDLDGDGRIDGIAPGNGVMGNPIVLPDDAYFVLGDNSPASQDSRLWTPDMLGPHLQDAYARGDYKVGTVPARDMIGRAFLVYWPGFLPLPRGPNIVPDIGRIRWIH